MLHEQAPLGEKNARLTTRDRKKILVFSRVVIAQERFLDIVVATPFQPPRGFRGKNPTTQTFDMLCARIKAIPMSSRA